LQQEDALLLFSKKDALCCNTTHPERKELAEQRDRLHTYKRVGFD
jgi:hypothetical protein